MKALFSKYQQNASVSSFPDFPCIKPIAAVPPLLLSVSPKHHPIPTNVFDSCHFSLPSGLQVASFNFVCSFASKALPSPAHVSEPLLTSSGPSLTLNSHSDSQHQSSRPHSSEGWGGRQMAENTPMLGDACPRGEDGDGGAGGAAVATALFCLVSYWLDRAPKSQGQHSDLRVSSLSLM